MGFSFVNYNFVIFHWQRRIFEGTQLQQCVSYEWHTIATCLFGCPRLVASCQFMCTLSYYGWQVCLPERHDMANMSISWHDHISYININIYILCIFMYHLSYIICHTEYMHVMSIICWSLSDMNSAIKLVLNFASGDLSRCSVVVLPHIPALVRSFLDPINIRNHPINHRMGVIIDIIPAKRAYRHTQFHNIS